MEQFSEKKKKNECSVFCFFLVVCMCRMCLPGVGWGMVLDRHSGKESAVGT